MLNFKTALSAIVFSAGIASAAHTLTLTSPITNVLMASHYGGTFSGGIYQEGGPAFLLTLGGVLYGSYYYNDKTKAMYQIAVSAAAAGKSVWIRYDADNKITHGSCSGYNAAGCETVIPGEYPKIQDIGIVP